MSDRLSNICKSCYKFNHYCLRTKEMWNKWLPFWVLFIMFICKLMSIIEMYYFYVQVSHQVASSLTSVIVETHRRKHLAYLMADQGALVNPESVRNLPKQVRSWMSWNKLPQYLMISSMIVLVYLTYFGWKELGLEKLRTCFDHLIN